MEELMALPRKRGEALASGAPHYFTGKPCKHGHLAARYAAGDCVECANAATNRWLAGRPEYSKEHYAANRERIAARTKKWKVDNPDKVRAARQRAAKRPKKRAP